MTVTQALLGGAILLAAVLAIFGGSPLTGWVFAHVERRSGATPGQTVAGIFRRALRNVDLCARLGGEEFAILLPNTPAANARHVAERVRTTLSSYRYTGLGLPPEDNVTISIGVATCPLDATTLDDLLELADKALYAAKSRGRDRVCQHEAVRTGPRSDTVVTQGDLRLGGQG